MKIPNYDSNFSATTGYKQRHPSMPADVFRMLICGTSNSGKTSILLHMIYKLLEFDKVYLSKNLHQNKYQALLRDFASNIDPDVGYGVVLRHFVITMQFVIPYAFCNKRCSIL